MRDLFPGSTPFGLPSVIGLALTLFGVGASRPVCAQTLQQAIDDAAPGDTVLVAPGTYTRAVTVDKAITLLAEGPGDSRLAGLEGSLATVVGLVFDGTLPTVPTTSVIAGDGLVLRNCRFEGGVRGVEIGPGGASVVLEGCTMSGVLEGIAFPAGVDSLLLDACTLQTSVAGLIGPDTLLCVPGPRSPADPCDGSPCGEIRIRQTDLAGGARQVDVAGAYRLILESSNLTGASGFAVQAAGVRLEMTNVEVSGVGTGTALLLDSVSGTIRSSQILAFGRALRVGDGGCPEYSALEIGGTLDFGNDIGGGTVVFQLAQAESVNAEFNFWGSTACDAVLPQISGQRVTAITDASHQNIYLCEGTPAEPSTWGRLKRRFGTAGGR